MSFTHFPDWIEITENRFSDSLQLTASTLTGVADRGISKKSRLVLRVKQFVPVKSE